MAWLYLTIAGIFEVVWVIGLKYSSGFSRLYPTLATVLGMMFSLYFLSLAVKQLSLGTAYAVWTGIGAVGAAVLGMLLFNEPRPYTKIFFLCLIIAGIIGLKLTSPDN